MVDLKKLQKEIISHKKERGFNVTDLNLEFNYLYEETAEAYRAYRKKLPDFGEELADVAIFLLSIAEISGIDLEKEMEKKMQKNKKREYKEINGVITRTKEG
jgi:NTP pyrophosphatase (non-canonical NTP hydrolase)